MTSEYHGSCSNCASHCKLIICFGILNPLTYYTSWTCHHWLGSQRACHIAFQSSSFFGICHPFPALRDINQEVLCVESNPQNSSQRSWNPQTIPGCLDVRRKVTWLVQPPTTCRNKQQTIISNTGFEAISPWILTKNCQTCNHNYTHYTWHNPPKEMTTREMTSKHVSVGKDFRKRHWSKPQKCSKCLAANVISPVQVLMAHKGSPQTFCRRMTHLVKRCEMISHTFFCYIKRSRVRNICWDSMNETCILTHESKMLNISNWQPCFLSTQNCLTRLATNRMVISLWQSSHGDGMANSEPRLLFYPLESLWRRNGIMKSFDVSKKFLETSTGICSINNQRNSASGSNSWPKSGCHHHFLGPPTKSPAATCSRWLGWWSHWWRHPPAA